MMIKKSMIGIMFLVILLTIGCLNYKAYDVPQDDLDTSLIDEIAAIERELGLNSDKIAPEVEEEVILPNLDEEVEEVLLEGDLDTLVVKESQLVKLKVNIIDPDGDEVAYSFSKPLDNEGKWQTSHGDAGEYIVTISATDKVHTTEKKVKIVVERVNVPPIIAKLMDILVNEGEVVNFEPKVSDPNNDPVEVTVSEPLSTGKFETDHNSAGEYMITVTANDGELQAKDSFKLQVNDVNVLPELSDVKDITIKEGEVVKISPTVTDLDGDEVKLSISEPVGDDGIWETKFTDHGEYMVTITADDGKDKVTKRVKIIVIDVNMPPEIISIFAE
jgi:nitrogen fixation protein FixH